MGETLLTGTRVIDFTTAGAGPRSTSQLAKLGAEVLKFEPPMPASSRIPAQLVARRSFRGSGLFDHLTGTFAAAAAILGLRRQRSGWSILRMIEQHVYDLSLRARAGAV